MPVRITARTRAGLAVGAVAIGLGLACSGSTSTGPAGPLHDITLTPDSAAIPIGGTQTLTATGHDAAGRAVTGLTFFWSSSSASIATVTQGGQVSGVDTGQVRIAASVQGVSGFATVTVTQKPVGSVIVAPSSATLRVATTLQLTDTVKDASGTVLSGVPVAWSSSDSTTVAVDQTGLVTSRKLGVAQISASAGGKSGTATITVSKVPVASISIAPSAPSVPAGQTLLLSATTKDSAGDILSGRVVRWHSETPAVATIDSTSGVLTGGHTGTSRITATSEGISASVTATVTASTTVGSVSITPHADTIEKGDQQQLTATVRDQSGGVISQPVTWSSSNSHIAAVDNSGLVTGVTPGQASIIASSGGKADTNTTVVLAPVARVIVFPTPDTIYGSADANTVQLNDSTKDASGNNLPQRPVTWSVSSGGGLAGVGGTGLVTATDAGAGSVTVTATSADGPQGSASITVLGHSNSGSIAPVDNPQHPDTLSASGAPGMGTPPYASGDNAVLTVTDTYGNTITGTRPVTWSSSDPSALGLSNQSASSATVTALNNGSLPETVTLTATVSDPHSSHTVPVTHQIVVIP